MRRITLRLLVALISFLAVVAVVAFVASRIREARKVPAAVEQAAAPDPVILDAAYYEGGNTCYEGEVNYFRLHASGLLEYDAIAEGTPCGPAESLKVERKRAKLSAAEARELVALARQPDFTSAAAEYPQYIIHTDTFSEFTITYTEAGHSKRVVVKNPAPDDPKTKAHYPPSLAEVLRRMPQIRGRLGEKW